MAAELPNPQNDAPFKCPCDGENNDCVHCDGTGWTRHKVELRSRRTLSLEKATPGRFRSKQELLFEQQFKREIPHLAARAFALRKEGIRSSVFVEYIDRLVEALDAKHTFSLCRHFAPKMAHDGELSALRSRLEQLDPDPSGPVGIVLQAVSACIRAGACRTSTGGKKDRALSAAHKTGDTSTPVARERPFACRLCGSMIYNQEQHNQLFHPKPESNGARAANKPLPKQALDPSPRPSRRAPSAPTPRRTARTRGSSGPAAARGIESARADTGSVEQAMDARRTWGGRFRDTNGTFGSYPLHDNMDDESGAG
ncbi:hypothetical protein [Acidovorax sp. sic0104]|uniref:hypothetical protein n=1 Tax=Acidovorax sp. sic0104 TaxID=2854784 RepID=UPI001C487506|nr:hypothetical protein [Acidovorax sp. sic0104]MBV7541989.1 hypothetical protein [Acidovorax sp. sic0104]